MKNLFTAIILSIALAGVSFAQNSFKPAQGAGASAKPKIAVVEFSPAPSTGLTDHEAKRQLQAFVASLLAKTHKVDVADVRNTRYFSQDNLAALNGNSTAAAVSLGKKMKVGYVLTGMVTEYDTKVGQVTLKARLVEVATGKVKYSGQATGRSKTPIRTGRPAEMMSLAVRPAIENLRDQILGM